MDPFNTFNHTDARIGKLFKRGLTLESIARKIGRPGETERVIKGLERLGIEVSEEPTEQDES